MRKGIFSTYTGVLIIINAIAFLISFFLISSLGESFISLSALNPSLLFTRFNFWTVITSMFMHANIGHLLANMVSLFFVGLFVEQLIGKKRLVIFYFVAGIFAALFYSILSFLFGGSLIGAKIFGSPVGFAMGASGAIFGLLGLLAVLTPRNRIYLIAGPLIAIIIQSILSYIMPESSLISLLNFFIGAYIIFSIFIIITFNPRLRKLAIPIEMPFWILPFVAIIPLVIIGLIIPLPIGNTAHLGGLLIGIVYGLYLKKKYPRKTKMISKHFSR